MMESEQCVIGIDVGGTHTDAVILKGRQVLAYSKEITSKDVTTGLICALESAIKKCKGKGMSLQQINMGTTHFVNAVVQRSGQLSKVTVLRLAKPPCTQAMPPFYDFPSSLRKLVNGGWRLLNGGFDYDGRELSPIDEKEIINIVGELISKQNQRHFVLSGVFSTVNHQHENQARQCILSNFPEVSVTCSYEMGHLGLLERENAAVLNQCLIELACSTLAKIQATVAQNLGSNCPLYLTQNDGTVCSIDQAMQFPVLTFASGPTNSMRGAAFISGIKNALVVDIGGTSTDVGFIKDGFPKQANSKVYVGGVPTLFRMPLTYSIGLGGGSIVREKEGSTLVGPESVGYRLTTAGVCFGGNTVTATDIAVAFGQAPGIAPTNADDINRIGESALGNAAMNVIKEKVENAIDHAKSDREPIPVVLVGGGAILVNEKDTLAGCPIISTDNEYAQVANAIGAALCQVSGFVDVVVSVDPARPDSRQLTLNEAKQRAIKAAIANGAVPDRVEVVECTEIPLTYLPGNAVQYKVRAVGDLAVDIDKCVTIDLEEFKRSAKLDIDTSEADEPLYKPAFWSDGGVVLDEDDLGPVREMVVEYCPFDESGVWNVSRYDVECIAVGAGILGCGGGGSPHAGKIRLLHLLSEGETPRVVTVDNLLSTCSSPEKCGGVVVACMGAPVCFSEKLTCNEESVVTLAVVVDILENPDRYSHLPREPFNGGVVYSDNVPINPEMLNRVQCGLEQSSICRALVCAEVGGANSMEPLALSALTGLPCADVDCMGRAYPELQMHTPYVYGEPWDLYVQTNEFGRVTVSWKADSPKDVENFHRHICIQNGCRGTVSSGLVPLAKLKEVCVQDSISRAWKLGKAVLDARRRKTSPIQAVVHAEKGKLLLTAKITDVHRRTERGFNWGFVTLQNLSNPDDEWTVTFQNENLLIKQRETIVATVPDLICILDMESGDPITTEDIRYGLRVCVVILPPSPLLTADRALSVFGPQAFGLNVPYKSALN